MSFNPQGVQTVSASICVNRPRLRQMLGSTFLVCAVSVFSGLVSALPETDPEQVGMSSTRLALITDTLKHYVDSGHVPGLVAGVARHGRIVYLQSLGWQDVESQQPMQPDSIFQIRSMSKPVTSLAVMQLIEQGRLGLGDPVSRYIPAFAGMPVFESAADPEAGTREASREITIADLLLHTSGLSHRDGALYRSRAVRSRQDTLAQLVEKVAAVPLIADPGTLWNYSISTTVLGRVVEIVSGQAFDEYLQASVFGPLALKDTGFYVPSAAQNRLANIYQLTPDAMLREPDMDVPITVNPPLLEGAAGMVSTVPDYLRFLQMFLNQGELEGNRLLSGDGVALMTRNQLAQEILPIALNPQRPMSDLGWGYGFSVVIDASQSGFARNEGEFGWNGSLGTFSWADPETGTVAVLMMQIQPSGAYNLSAIFKSLVAQSITSE